MQQVNKWQITNSFKYSGKKSANTLPKTRSFILGKINVRRLIYLLVLLVNLESFNVNAQDFPSLAIDDVLGSDFKIVSQFPIVFWDDESKLITYINYEMEQRLDIPYPDKIKSFDKISEYSDDSFLLYSADHSVWLFEPLKETIQLAPTQCNVIQAPLGKGQWLQNVDEAGKISFCNTETGQLTDIIPELTSENLECYYEGSTNSLVEIIEENQLLGITCDTLQAFTYSVDSGVFSILGTMEKYHDSRYEFERFNQRIFTYQYLGNSHILIKLPRWITGFNSPFDSQLYFADLSQENSVSFIGFDTDYSSYSNRYYWSEVDESNNQIIVHQFDVETLEQSVWKTFDCTPMKTCFDGQIFVSPGLKYIAITNMTTRGHTYPDLSLVIFNVESGRQITQDDEDINFFNSDLIWVDDNQFLAVEETAFHSNLYAMDMLETYQRLLSSESFNQRLNASADRRYFIFHTDIGINLFDSIEREKHSLISETSQHMEFGDKSYTVRIASQWHNDNQIKITAYSQTDTMILGRWLVELDSSGE